MNACVKEKTTQSCVKIINIFIKQPKRALFYVAIPGILGVLKKGYFIIKNT